MSTNPQNSSGTVPAVPQNLPPDTRSNLERMIDEQSGRSWADVHAAEDSPSQNFSDESFNPATTLRALMDADDEPRAAPESAPVELGDRLSDGSLRLLRLAQGDDALTEDERARLDAAEHREQLDHALSLATDNAHRLAEISEAITVDRTDLDFELSVASEKGADLEAVRRQKIGEIAPALRWLAKGLPIDAATSARLSHVNVSRILKLLREGTKLRDLPLDLVKNY